MVGEDSNTLKNSRRDKHNLLNIKDNIQSHKVHNSTRTKLGILQMQYIRLYIYEALTTVLDAGRAGCGWYMHLLIFFL